MGIREKKIIVYLLPSLMRMGPCGRENEDDAKISITEDDENDTCKSRPSPTTVVSTVCDTFHLVKILKSSF